MKKVGVIIFPFILGRFFFISNATNLKCRKPGVLKPQQGVKGCCPLRTFVGYKYHLDWIKIDLNVAKIITVQDYKHFKK